MPCLTVRANTERPVTISQGTNRLVASHRAAIVLAAQEALHRMIDDATEIEPPELWDGSAAQRITHAMLAV